MSITKNNIADFITYLFRKRRGQDPPAQLLASWQALSNEEIAQQLSGLFHSWGLTDEDKRAEINAYFKETLFAAKPQQPATRVVPVPVQDTHPANAPAYIPPPASRRKRWPLFVVLALLIAGGGYVGVQYMAFSNMQYIYTITDNVLVRDENKEVVARMDLYEVKGSTPSYQKLKAVDKNIYYRSIDETDKTYPFRKVLLKESSFFSYLLKRNADIGYVNTNYVVDNVQEFDLYQTAFREVKNNKAENADLKAIYRKIIIGSMSLDPATSDKYITLHTGSIPRSAADATYGIIKQTIKENVKYVLIAGLSDGFYYSFAGDIQANDFSAPQKIMVTNAEKETKPLNGAYRFMDKDNKIILYDCLTNTPTNYEAQRDSNGRISSFVYNAPSFLEQIFE